MSLPIEALTAWSTLNDITLVDIQVRAVDGKGNGLVCDRNLTTRGGTFDLPILMTVPHALVLNADAVEEYAKEDRNFRMLLDAAGHKSARTDILIFLLAQSTLAATAGQTTAGVSNPWTGYIGFLPKHVSVPTLWNEDERSLLRGTSLESALSAKLLSLEAEFGAVREAAANIAGCNSIFWPDARVRLRDWVLLDALFRSRCLELPKSGMAMVPFLDMANHSSNCSAYYEETANNEVVLLLRPDVDLSSGDGLTINYGAKSAAEMLFSYGFINRESTIDTAVFPLEPLPDDPLARAKIAAFGKPPTISLARTEAGLELQHPFAYFMCVNEEDGLEFRVLQETNGAQQLRVFWRETDVTDSTGDFESLTRDQEFHSILRLRVLTAIQQTLQAQLDRMSSVGDDNVGTTDGTTDGEGDPVRLARLLRGIESKLLKDALETLAEEESRLMTDDNVIAYLGAMDGEKPEPVMETTTEPGENEDDDFS